MKILLAAMTFTTAFFAADTLGCEGGLATEEASKQAMESREGCEPQTRKEVIPGMI